MRWSARCSQATIAGAFLVICLQTNTTSPSAPYPIEDVSTWPVANPEETGSREKEWLLGPDGSLHLLKFPREDRPEIGEIWAEKVTCEIAAALALPHVHYVFAKRETRLGVLCKSFIDNRTDDLHLGNMLLGISQSEPTQQRRKLARTAHTLENVLGAIQGGNLLVPPGFEPSSSVQRGVDVFVGYLLLDAIVSNTDRHEQNWGIIRTSKYVVDFERAWLSGRRVTDHLAPTFDHASSLGRELADSRRQILVETPSLLEEYLSKATSKLYTDTGNQIHTMEAFRIAGRRYPDASAHWLSKLRLLDIASVERIFERIEPSLISPTSMQLARIIVKSNMTKLIEGSILV